MRPPTRCTTSLLLAMLVFSACRDVPSRGLVGPDVSRAESGVGIDATTYTAQALSLPPRAISGEASAINDLGDVAGWYQSSSGWRAVRWSGSQRLDLGMLPGMSSALAEGINQAGTIVGYAASADFSRTRAFIWTVPGGMQPLPTLGGGVSVAAAINRSGVAVGWASDPNGVVHAVKWRANRTIVDLNPPGAMSQAMAVNDSGDVVGWIIPTPGAATRAFLWRNSGARIELGTLGGLGSQALGVNASLSIVGVSDRRPPHKPVAFIWTPARGMRDLGLGSNSQAFGISELGRAVGVAAGSGVTGLTRVQGVTARLPDLAPTKGPFSGPTAVNRCGTIVGSGASPLPANGNFVPVIWRPSACDVPGGGT